MVLREPVSATSWVVQRRGVIATETDQVWELVDEATDERTALSAEAVRLWELLDGEHTVGQIAEQLGQPLGDVIELIRRLRANGLAGDSDPAAPTASPTPPAPPTGA
jgi:hypothetical protein